MLSQILIDVPTTSLHLDNYAWKNRVVLVFSDETSGELHETQTQHLLQDRAGLVDRDLLVFSIKGDEEITESVNGNTFATSEHIKSAYWKSGKGYFIILIGKDGSVKFEDDSFLHREKLYAIIDAMPMRRAEMRRNSSGN